MPTKRSWWSNNFSSVIWTVVFSICTSLFYFGSAWNTLQKLPNREDVRELSVKSTKNLYYPLIDGVKLTANIEHIKDDVTEVKRILMEIYDGSRTVANKNAEREKKTKRMAIIIPPPSGNENKLINDVKKFELRD